MQEDNDDDEFDDDNDNESDGSADDDDCNRGEDWFWEFRLFNKECGTITALGVLIIIVLPIVCCFCVLFFSWLLYNDGTQLQPPEADETAPLISNILRQDQEETFFEAFEKKKK